MDGFLDWFSGLPHAPKIFIGGNHEGCADLRATLATLPALRLHVFGHIHTGYGRYEHDGITFVNAALLVDDCNLREDPPMVVSFRT